MTSHTDLDTLDIIFHEAGLAAAEHGESTLAERRKDREMVAALRRKIAATRRRITLERAQTDHAIAARPVRSELLAMDRPGLLARLSELLAGNPGLQYAHNRNTGLSDDDLRRLIAELEALASRD